MDFNMQGLVPPDLNFSDQYDPQEEPEVQQGGIMALKGLVNLARKEPEQAAFTLDKIAPGMTVRELNDPATMQAAAMRILQPRMYDLDKRLAAAQANQQDISRDLEALANRPSFSRGNALGAALAGLAVGFATKGKPGGGLGYGLMAAGGVAKEMQKDSLLDRELEKDLLTRKSTVAADEIKRLSGERADLQDRAEDFSLDALADQFSSNLQSARMREKAGIEFSNSQRLEGLKQSNREANIRLKASLGGGGELSEPAARSIAMGVATGDWKAVADDIANNPDIKDKGKANQLMFEGIRATTGSAALANKMANDKFKQDLVRGAAEVPNIEWQNGIIPQGERLEIVRSVNSSMEALAHNINKMQAIYKEAVVEGPGSAWWGGTQKRRLDTINAQNYVLLQDVLRLGGKRLAKDVEKIEKLAINPASTANQFKEFFFWMSESDKALSDVLKDLGDTANRVIEGNGGIRKSPWGSGGIKEFEGEQGKILARNYATAAPVDTVFKLDGWAWIVTPDGRARPLGQETISGGIYGND